MRAEARNSAPVELTKRRMRGDATELCVTASSPQPSSPGEAREKMASPAQIASFICVHLDAPVVALSCCGLFIEEEADHGLGAFADGGFAL